MGFNYKFGIVLCCHNRPEYLQPALDSLAGSSLKNSCIHIIDDFSDCEETQSLIHNFKLSGGKNGNNVIKTRNTSNQRIALSLKKGFDSITREPYRSEFFTNIDSDVLLKPDWLEKLHSAFIFFQKAKKILGNSRNLNNAILTGFNNDSNQRHKILNDFGGFYHKDSMGGINMFFHHSLYKKIFLPVLTKNRAWKKWDWNVCSNAKQKNVTLISTKPSVVQHLGMQGMWSKGEDSYDFASDF